MAKLFGCREIDITSGESYTVAGKSLPVANESQILTLQGNVFGKVKTLYFNSFVGLDMNQNQRPELEKLMFDYVAPQNTLFAEKEEHVHIAQIESATKHTLLAINFDMKQEESTLAGVPESAAVTELFTNTTTKVAKNFKFSLAPMQIAVYVWDK